MHKSVPVSLGVIAFSVAVIAGAVIYDRVNLHNQQQAKEEELAELAHKNAVTQCRDRLAALTVTLPKLEAEAAQYAPDPEIKNPETLNDVQAILYKNKLADISQAEADIMRLTIQCGSASSQS